MASEVAWNCLQGESMKLVRHGLIGSERPGIIDREGRIRDLTGLIPDVVESALLPQSLEALRGSTP